MFTFRKVEEERKSTSKKVHRLPKRPPFIKKSLNAESSKPLKTVHQSFIRVEDE